MTLFSHVVVILSTVCFPCLDALECYMCSNVENVSTCGNITLCKSGQSCFMNTSSSGNRLGCIDDQQCGTLANTETSLIGRGIHDNAETQFRKRQEILVIADRYLTERNADQCFECCSSDICNIHLCNHPKPSSCVDDSKVDCALINSKFNICQNIHEAKTICPKFCRLCSLVDGQWAEWSVWSFCDVTCGNGTETRTRQCSNPVPVSGGLGCQGHAKETRACILKHCPTDGNWADWSPWTGCDVTCDNGTQTRLRTCNNPAPAYDGQKCSGNSSDSKICMKELCPIHGGWTVWLEWETCSVTCDIGIQLRHRNCSNPKPQLFGDHCFGDPLEARLCQPGPCANGGWSAWNSWSSCSLTCGGGIKSRSRSCTNPRPSALGRQCEGDAMQDISCNFITCSVPATTIMFRAKDLVDLSTVIRTLIFKTVTINYGHGYDNNTGVFTAPIAGTYSFTTQLCVDFAQNYAHCSIEQNGVPLISSNFQGGSHAPCSNAVVYAVLKANDTVSVKLIAGNGNFYEDSTDRWSTFSGVLLVKL